MCRKKFNCEPDKRTKVVYYEVIRALGRMEAALRPDTAPPPYGFVINMGIGDRIFLLVLGRSRLLGKFGTHLLILSHKVMYKNIHFLNIQKGNG